MTASKSLPDRPSLESLRKQAKKIARDRRLTLRTAQLAIAREYGFDGWRDLTAEVSQRLGRGLEWAAQQARRAIHDNDVDRLKQLLTEYPALLTWCGDDPDSSGGVLGIATGAYGDSFDSQREQAFTRAACAELLIDAGAVVMPVVPDGLLQARARGLLELFRRKGVLPRTLKFFSALGDLDAVRRALDQNANDLTGIGEAFLHACRFKHEDVASLLLERSIALDPELGIRIDASGGRLAFITHFVEKGSLDPTHATALGPWKAFVLGCINHALREGDLAAFVRGLERDPWLLRDAFVWFQVELVENAALNDRQEFIAALLNRDPALLRRQPPPASQAIEIAFTYAHTHLIPLLTRIWPLPDDLPYAAGTGDLARVKHWFDETGAPALGDLDHHYPYNDARARSHLRWEPPSAQQILDVALAFSVINRHFDVADFLLQHGADINTNWNSHEPASILHHLVFEDNYDSMQFLIDRGIDMTIKDYRWNSTARGWAMHGKDDKKMAQWLDEAERRRAGS